LKEGLVGRGGGQGATWLPQLALSWESCQDFEIHWAVFDKLAKNDLSITYLNQTFHRIPYISMSASLLLRRWPHRLCASRLTRRIKPDLIHCWGTENLNGAALLGFKGPSILSMQGIVKTCLKTGDLNTWQWKLLRHYEPESIRLAKIVTCESQWGLDRVAEISPQKMTHRVEYGVFPSFYKTQWEPIIDSPRFLFVGGLNRLKGIDILIKMLRRHPKRNWKMVFVGDGYTDIPCFSLVRQSGGFAFGVWDPKHRDKRSRAWGFIEDGRVSNLNQARYDTDAELYQWLEEAVTSLAARIAVKSRMYRG
jgi:glycosyltransferase involved in cell wall biosynthesis